MRIGGQKVHIKMKDDLKHEGVELLGLCDYQSNTIWLQKGMPPSKRRAVLVHEYWHFVDAIYGLGMGEKKVNTLEVETMNLMHSMNML